MDEAAEEHDSDAPDAQAHGHVQHHLSSRPERNDSSTSPHRETKKLTRPIIRGAQACSQCRQHKIRCIPSAPDNPFPCTRCTNNGLICEVLKHNRGRKRKVMGDETPPPPPKQPATYYPNQNGTGPSSRPNTAAVDGGFYKYKAYDSAPGFGMSTPSMQQAPIRGELGSGKYASGARTNMHVWEEAIAMRGRPSTSMATSRTSPNSMHRKHHSPPQSAVEQFARSLPYRSAETARTYVHNTVPRPLSASSLISGQPNDRGPAGQDGQSTPAHASANTLPSLSSYPYIGPTSGRPHVSSQFHQLAPTTHPPYGNHPHRDQPYEQSDYTSGRSRPHSQPSFTDSERDSHSIGLLNSRIENQNDLARHPASRSAYSLPPLMTAGTSGSSAPQTSARLPSLPSWKVKALAEPQVSTYTRPLPQHSSVVAVDSADSEQGASNETRPFPHASPHHLTSQATRENTFTVGSSDSNYEGAPLDAIKFPFLSSRSERRQRRGMFSITSIFRNGSEKINGIEEKGVHTSRGGVQSHHRDERNSKSGDPGDDLGSDSLEEEAHLPPFNHSDDESGFLSTDPVDAGVLSPKDAETLFTLYMEEMGIMNCLLDPSVHTHDFVRQQSTFLYVAILSVMSRYLNMTCAAHSPIGRFPSKKLISPIYAYCQKAARIHLRYVLSRSIGTLEVVQGLALLACHKEPQDEKACIHLSAAIAIARDLGLDKVPAEDARHGPAEEQIWTRIQQRVWKSLFVLNTILTMQFDMRTLIPADDAAVVGCSRWHIGSHLASDALLIASIQLRRLWHIYDELIRALERSSDPGEDRTLDDRASKLISFSVITRTANRELEQCASEWKEQCAVAEVGRVDCKIDVYLAAIKLKLNLTIVQSVLPALKGKVNRPDWAPPNSSTHQARFASELGCVAAFHHSVTAACTILQSMPALEEKRLLSFAADTFLHFTIYSAFFLWTLCRDVGPEVLEPAEAEHCFLLISNAATALESASLFPGDSPSLHARFLRGLCQSGSNLINRDMPASLSAASNRSSSPEDPSLRSSQAIAGVMLMGAVKENPPDASLPLKPGDSSNDSSSNLNPHKDVGRVQVTLNAINQNADMGTWSTSDFDSMLLADWSLMQKDFPWVFDDPNL